MNDLIESNVMETRCFKSWLREDGIVCNQVVKNAELVLEDAKDGVNNYQQLSNKRGLPLLVDLREIHSVSADARAYFSRDNVEDPPLGNAILIGSAVSRVIGNFFLGLNKPTIPTKLFTDEDKAIEWLKGFKSE